MFAPMQYCYQADGMWIQSLVGIGVKMMTGCNFFFFFLISLKYFIHCSPCLWVCRSSAAAAAAAATAASAAAASAAVVPPVVQPMMTQPPAVRGSVHLCIGQRLCQCAC